MKYIGFYDSYKSLVQRIYSAAAVDKMTYISEVLSQHEKVDIFSLSPIIGGEKIFYGFREMSLTENIRLIFPPSVKIGKIFHKYIVGFWNALCLLVFLLLKTRKNETVIVYHSTGYFFSIILAKLVKRFKLILEVEEIYANASRLLMVDRYIERKTIEIADAYIFASDTLNLIINKFNKPYVVIYGNYKLTPLIADKYEDGKIHVVYAGTFDQIKGGAQVSISAAEFLDEKYHVHICGFGEKSEVEDIIDRIKNMQSKSRATITYEGLLKGNEYLDFIQKCHIGLSTQNPVGIYNDTSFPCKIISYLSNGLNVVSINIKAVSMSKIAPYVSLYVKHDPSQIAKAIEEVHNQNSTRSLIQKLHKEFEQNLLKLLYY